MPKIASSSLTPASVIDEPRLGSADDRRAHRQRGAERVRLVAAHDGVAVVDVHERVGAGLQLGEHAELVVEVVRARAAARDDAAARGPRRRAARRGVRAAAAARARARAPGRSRRCSGGRRRSPGRPRTRARRTRRSSRASATARSSSARPVRRAADLDVDEHLERPPRASAGLGQLRDVARVVGDDDQAVGARVQRRQPLQLRGRDDRGEQHHAGDAGVGHHLGLGQRRAAHADAAGGDLPACDVDRLVHLRDGPQRVAVRLRVLPRATRCSRRGRPDRARARACRAREREPGWPIRGSLGPRFNRASIARRATRLVLTSPGKSCRARPRPHPELHPQALAGGLEHRGARAGSQRRPRARAAPPAR